MFLMTALDGERVVRPALGTLDEKLNRSAERESQSVEGNTFGKDDRASAA